MGPGLDRRARPSSTTIRSACADRREAVGDEDHGVAAQLARQAVEDAGLRAGCRPTRARRRGPGSGRRTQERPREGRALLLAAGEGDPALADHRVEPEREGREVRVQPGHGGRLPDALRGPSRVRPVGEVPARIVSENRNASWGTTANARRSALRAGTRVTSTPSRKTVPGGGS